MLMLFLPLLLFGCNSKTNKPDNIYDNEKNISTTGITLVENDIKIINDTLEKLTKETAYENAAFKIEISEKNNKSLEISVIKPITDIMSYFNVNTADDTVKSIRNSLIFDTIYDNIKTSLNKDFEGMTVYYYDNEDLYNKNEFYTLKSVSNK
jgi:tetrahydromethanopterin S-methyltransferase subunit A